MWGMLLPLIVFLSIGNVFVHTQLHRRQTFIAVFAPTPPKKNNTLIKIKIHHIHRASESTDK